LPRVAPHHNLPSFPTRRSSDLKVTLDISGEKVELDNEDIQVRLQAKPGWAAAQGSNVVVVLATELTPELLAEGLARDFVRIVQEDRKSTRLNSSHVSISYAVFC